MAFSQRDVYAGIQGNCIHEDEYAVQDDEYEFPAGDDSLQTHLTEGIGHSMSFTTLPNEFTRALFCFVFDF